MRWPFMMLMMLVFPSVSALEPDLGYAHLTFNQPTVYSDGDFWNYDVVNVSAPVATHKVSTSYNAGIFYTNSSDVVYHPENETGPSVVFWDQTAALTPGSPHDYIQTTTTRTRTPQTGSGSLELDAGETNEIFSTYCLDGDLVEWNWTVRDWSTDDIRFILADSDSTILVDSANGANGGHVEGSYLIAITDTCPVLGQIENRNVIGNVTLDYEYTLRVSIEEVIVHTFEANNSGVGTGPPATVKIASIWTDLYDVRETLTTNGSALGSSGSRSYRYEVFASDPIAVGVGLVDVFRIEVKIENQPAFTTWFSTLINGPVQWLDHRSGVQYELNGYSVVEQESNPIPEEEKSTPFPALGVLFVVTLTAIMMSAATRRKRLQKTPGKREERGKEGFGW